MEELMPSITITEHLYRDLIVLSSLLMLITVVYFVFNFLIKLIKKKFDTIDRLKNLVDSFYRISKIVIALLSFVLFFGILSFGLYYIYLGVDLVAFGTGYMNTLSQEFWLNLLKVFGKLIFLLIISKFIYSLLVKGLNLLKIKVISLKNIEANRGTIKLFFQRSLAVIKYGIIFIVMILAGKLFALSETILAYIYTLFKIYILFSIGFLFVNAISVIVKTFDNLSKKFAQKKGLIQYYAGLEHLIPLFQKTLEYIIYVLVATLMLQELSFIAWMAKYGEGVVKAIGLIFIARVIIEIIKLAVDTVYLNDNLEKEKLQQNKTIFPIVISIVSLVIYFIIFALIIQGFGYNPLPLLTGAGILGMVIGMGAKDIIGDVLSGFFIIFDGTFKVGDRINSDDVTGIIEHISLRTVKVRELDGSLVTIRNGNLDKVVNYSDKYINAVVSIGVKPDSDINKVLKTLENIGQKFRKENSNILDDLIISGIKEINGTQVLIRTSTKVKVGTNFTIESELRKTILDEFQKENIEFAPLVYDKLK